MEPFRQGPGGGTIFELVHVTTEPVSGPDTANKAFLYYLKDVGFRVKLFGSDGEPLTEANVSVLLEAQVTDPPAVANHGQIYAKTTGGVVQFFYRANTGTIYQITPVVTASDISTAVAAEAATRAAAITSEANTRIAADALEGQARMDADAGLQSSINALNGLTIHKDGSVPFEADQSMGSHKLTNLTDPSGPQDADTKAARDAAIAGLNATFAALILKDFFSTWSFLPATAHLEAKYTYPATDFQNLDGGSYATAYGGQRLDSANNKIATWGWDFGALKSKGLIVLGGVRGGSGEIGIFFANTTPGSTDLADGSYLFLLSATTASLYKRAGGAFVLLDANTKTGIDVAITGAHVGMALYYDDATGTLQSFVRSASGIWIACNLVTGESTFTTMRYAGVRAAASGTPTFQSECPVGLYYTA